jgi:UDP-2-acetamido-3-amino-2,3-dideoxy-glucuronate N-acetyltransferase
MVDRSRPFVGKFPNFVDPRGSLGVVEFADVPFTPRRIFWIFGVAEGETRANHGHRECEQLVFVQQGSVGAVILDKTGERSEFRLGVGEFLCVPPRHWLQLREFSSGAVLGVLASLPYDRSEYIDDPRELDS